MLSSLTQHLRRIFGRQAAIMVETVRIIHLNFIIYANVLIFSFEIRENNITSDRVCVHVRSFKRDSKNRLFFPPRSLLCVYYDMGYMCDACDKRTKFYL